MFSLKEEKREIKILLIIICLLFFAVCLFTIIKYGNTTMLGNLQKPDNDDAKFVRSAWILADTGNYVYHNTSIATTFMMPGVSYILALFTIIFGKLGGLTAFRIFQAITQTISLMLVFFLGRKVFDSHIGVIATFFRPTITLFPSVILIIWLINKYKIKDIIKNTIIVTIVFCIILIPWWTQVPPRKLQKEAS